MDEPILDPNRPQQRLQGNTSEASIDQVNTWMRGTPWYQDMMRAWGQDPGHPTLNDQQRHEVVRAAQAQGVQVDEGDVEMDPHGNFNPKGHKLRNTLIVAGIAGATIATMGAAGVFAGAAGAGAGAGGGAGTAAGLAGVEGGAFGLTGAGAAGLGAATAVPALAGGGAAAAGAGAAGASAGGGILGGGGAATTGTGIGSRILNGARDVAPILAGAADSRAQGQQQNYSNDVTAEQLRLQAPGIQLSNLQKANRMAAGPVKSEWGGPGSGLRGETVKFTGGAAAPMTPESQAAMPGIIDRQIQESLRNPADNPAMNPRRQQSGVMDKILGGAALGTSLLGGMRRR